MSDFYSDWKSPFYENISPDMKQEILKRANLPAPPPPTPQAGPDLERIRQLVEEAIRLLDEEYPDGALQALEEIRLLLP